MEDYNHSLDFECPICAAPALEKCTVQTGSLRSESHLERIWIAKDFEPKRLIVKVSIKASPTPRLPD
jgi:hypothetical protein